MKKRKICVVTGSRAEYGILRPLLEEIKNDSALKLQIIATGMHLSPEFDLTYREIEKDGFTIDEKIEMLSGSDTSAGISRSIGLAITRFPEAYERLKPDLIVVLGDRFEIFGAVVPALISKIPVAHIAGGEVTEGAFDEALRHAITKMSHLHFVATEKYRRRVIQLGENPATVFNVGAPGVDAIKNADLLSRKELENNLKIKFNKHNFLIVFHPATLNGDDAPKNQFQELISVIDELKDTNAIFIKSNADTNARVINQMIDQYVASNHQKARAFTSLGHLKYLSVLRMVDAIIGNSSSGISEAPSLKVATVNIGNRQKGRIRAASIIDCDPTRSSIERGLKRLYSKKFQKSLKTVRNPYGNGEAAKKIKEIIKEHDLKNICTKKFFDIKG